MSQTLFRTCTLCEAMCGLAFEVDGERIVDVRPDEDDVFSRGYICPKGTAIADIHNDPDRLREPVRRTASGTFEPIGWDEAFDLVAENLNRIRARHGADALALYMGNPIGHNHGVLALRNGLFRASARATARARLAGYQSALRRVVLPVRQFARCPGARYRAPLRTCCAWGPIRVSRTAAFLRLRIFASGCRAYAAAADGSWSSIRAVLRPPARRMSTWRSCPAAMRHSCCRLRT